MCVGPPASQTHTTEVFFTGLPAAAASARAANKPGNVNAAGPSAPTFKNSRRVVPSQSRKVRSVFRVNIAVLVHDLDPHWASGGVASRLPLIRSAVCQY